MVPSCILIELVPSWYSQKVGSFFYSHRVVSSWYSDVGNYHFTTLFMHTYDLQMLPVKCLLTLFTDNCLQ